MIGFDQPLSGNFIIMQNHTSSDKTGHSEQTAISFRDKWEKNQSLAFDETQRVGSDIFEWILNRNGFDTPEMFSEWLLDKKTILDAGCGNGRVTALLKKYAESSTKLTGIDLTAAEVASHNLKELENVSIFQKDLLGDLSDIGKFDLIYCQEVLHHTADPKAAFLNLTKCLTDKGEIAIYVYKEKAPIREHADDYIRDQISNLPYSDAITHMREIANLGKALSDIKLKVNIPQVSVLGIEAGEYDIQRFLYHHFLKCFWNEALTEQENVAINYDWYHPQLCTRHTLSEVRTWFNEAELEIRHECVDYYGITVRGVKC